jgi:hypothetical protein
VNAEARTRSKRLWEVTVESDWITTVSMAALFLICVLLLASEIHAVVRDHIIPVALARGTFSDIFTKAFEVIAAIYCFIAGLRHPTNSIRFGKSVKFAFVLVGIHFGSTALLGLFHTSLVVRHAAAVIGTIMMQIALAIFCVAIASWFRSIVHWHVDSEHRGGGF